MAVVIVVVVVVVVVVSQHIFCDMKKSEGWGMESIAAVVQIVTE